MSYLFARHFVWPTIVAICVCACSETANRRDASTPAAGPVRKFDFVGAEGERFSSEGSHGRATVVVFVTTYDLLSQLMARQINDLVRRYQPRVNAGAVVLESPKYAALSGAFRDTLELKYPVVMADRATLSGNGPFGNVRGVPTTVVLTATGREYGRFEGEVALSDIEEAITRAQQASDQVH